MEYFIISVGLFIWIISRLLTNILSRQPGVTNLLFVQICYKCRFTISKILEKWEGFIIFFPFWNAILIIYLFSSIGKCWMSFHIIETNKHLRTTAYFLCFWSFLYTIEFLIFLHVFGRLIYLSGGMKKDPGPQKKAITNIFFSICYLKLNSIPSNKLFESSSTNFVQLCT